MKGQHEKVMRLFV